MQKSAKQIVVTSLIGLLAFVMSACPGNTGNTNANEVAATVNGKPISMKEVEDLLHQQMQGQETQLSKLEISQARLQILGGLVQKEVLFQRAEKENLIPTEDEITKDINDKIQQSGKTADALAAELTKNNQTMPSLREETRKVLAIKKLQDRITNKVQTPTDKTVEDFFNSNKQLFVRQRGVELAVITVTPQDGGLSDDAKSEAEAKLKADQIHQQLKNGADFATVARARSEDQHSARGGDIGFASEEDLKGKGFPPELIARFFGLEVGSYTDPINIGGGYYIFKLVGKQTQAENLTLQSPNVKEQITTAIVNQQKQLLIAALEVAAMSDAKVDNLLAKKLLENPENLNVLRPAPQPGQSPIAPPPAATATPTSTTTVTPAPTTPTPK